MSLLAALRAKLFGFFSARTASTAITFTLALVPVVAAVGAAVDFSRGNSIHAALQDSLDGAALNLVKSASSLTASQITATASSYTLATFNRPDASNVSTTAAYDKTAGVLTLTGSAVMQNQFMGFFGFTQMNIKATAEAKLAPKIWPVCVLITASTQLHTLLTANNGHVVFDNCMVQVNTTDWDAVEARNTSYIHSTNGDNCFVGDIHYGDVQPPKDPSCTFFADPFAGYKMPASAATCTFTNYKVTGNGVTLKPGTYCGSTTLNGGNITLSPGLYIINSGDLTITGNSIVTANGVTILFTGTGPNFYINQNAQLTITPASGSVAGQFAGFVFYLDNNSDMTACASVTDGARLTGGKSAGDCVNAVDNNAKLTMSGIAYLTNAAFLADNNAVVTVNSGSLIANFLVANNNAVFSLTGTGTATTSAQIAMQKSGGSNQAPVLIK
jgi:Flp pilus assembly protein TadG